MATIFHSHVKSVSTYFIENIGILPLCINHWGTLCINQH
jgi:hypothetical protein